MKGASLIYHLVLWFIVVALLPLLLFGYLSLRQNESALITETQARMSRLADKKVMALKVYLAERTQDVQILAHSLLVEQAMSGLSRAYLQYRPGSAGYQSVDKQFRNRFAVYINEGALFYDVFLITSQGEIIYTDKHEADFATNLLDGPYRDSQLAKAFRESRMTMESSFSDFEAYAPSNAPAAFVTAPIIRNGAFSGVIAFQLSIDNFYRMAMDNTGLGMTGETPLAKLAGADEALFIVPLKHDPQAAMRRKIDLKATSLPMRHALAGERGSGIGIDYAGVPVVAAWRYLPELRCGVVTKMDAAEVFSPLYQQRNSLLEILLTLILLAGVAAFSFGRRLAVPLKNFAQTANEIAQGDLTKRVVESGSGEIGALGRSFNRMAENLQALYRSLENRVEERTRELNVSNEQLQRELYERKLMEQELIRSETKFHTLFDSTSDAVVLLDENGFFECNKTALAMFGCATREELCSKHPADLSPPLQPCGTDSLTLANRRIATAMEQGSNYFEWVHQRVDTGKIFHSDVLLSRMDLGGRKVLQATVRDITSRKLAEGEIRSLAFYDALTGLPNRRLLNDRLSQILAASKRSGCYGALMFLDLDNFKPLNDAHGHSVGDLLLIEVAHRLTSCVREIDTVARFGGDEFVVMLSELDADKTESLAQAGIVAEKIRAALAEPYLLKIQREGKAETTVEHHCAASIGVVVFNSKTSAEDVLKWADLAMYQAKEAGRNLTWFYDSTA